jgi:hypothetical protein
MANPPQVEIFAHEAELTNKRNKLRRPGDSGKAAGCNDSTIRGRPLAQFRYNEQKPELADISGLASKSRSIRIDSN